MILRNCDFNTFSKITQRKRIICYGIGKEFERIAKSYSSYSWFERISFLADGDTRKTGNTLILNEREYQIISVEMLKQAIDQNTVILITSMAYYDIVKAFNAMSVLNKTECYLFHFMFSESEKLSIQIKQLEKAIIPPIIHYCWFGRKPLPDIYKRYMESWTKYCPNYEIREWNEDNCDINETVYTQQAYEHGKYGFVPDYFRLKIIYENGGIYLDTDVELLRCIDDLRYNNAFCGLEFAGEVNLGLGFGACIGHPVLKILSERYKKMTFVNEDGSLNEVASPIYQSEDMKKMGLAPVNRLQNVNDFTIYPIEVLSPQNVYTGVTSISDYSYMWHHFDGSWLSGERLAKKNKRHNRALEIQEMFETDGECI